MIVVACAMIMIIYAMIIVVFENMFATIFSIVMSSILFVSINQNNYLHLNVFNTSMNIYHSFLNIRHLH